MPWSQLCVGPCFGALLLCTEPYLLPTQLQSKDLSDFLKRWCSSHTWQDAPMESAHLFHRRLKQFMRKFLPLNRPGLLGRVQHYCRWYECQARGSCECDASRHTHASGHMRVFWGFALTKEASGNGPAPFIAHGAPFQSSAGCAKAPPPQGRVSQRPRATAFPCGLIPCSPNSSAHGPQPVAHNALSLTSFCSVTMPEAVALARA
jgi:hypothetical protein